jgi:two-component system cell cycle response regulator
MTARVLVCDDIEANVRLLEAKLQVEYFDVIGATRGEEAVQKARRLQPDIILLDVMMPGIDGFETCRRLKASAETRHIPVIMVTTLDGREDRLRGLQAGAEDFLTKPIDDVQLMARVKSLVRLKIVTDELRAREASGMRLGVIDDDMRPDALDQHRLIGGHVLVVDDSERQAERISAALNAEHTVSFLGGKDAQAAPDLVIVSLNARGFDGCKVSADALRSRLDHSMELAVTDQLTGLYNRRFLHAQLAPLVQRATCGGDPVSVMLVDLDHFKQINDAYGHDMGDAVLKEFSARLASNTRPVDYACRLGGEEFVVIMPNTRGDTACLAAERLRRHIAGAPFAVGEPQVHLDVTVSIGVAETTSEDDTAEAILKRADEGLYEAKRAGRNRVIGKTPSRAA